MTESTEQVFFTKKHSRLANIASLAKIIAWVYLVIDLIEAVAWYFNSRDFLWTEPSLSFIENLPKIINQFKYDFSSISIFFLSQISNFLQPIIYWLILMAISTGLNMIIETDLNYRADVELTNEPVKGKRPKAMRAVVTETARVFKETFQKKSTDNATEENPDIKFTEGEQPVFYKPLWVLQLDKWLGIAAVITIAHHIVHGAFNIDSYQQYFLSLFGNNTNLNFLAWMTSILISLIDLGSQVLFVFFSMIALGTILKVLMELEFNSRGIEK